MKQRIAFNLITFSNTKAIGTFVFTRRIFKEFFKCDTRNYEIVIYIQKGISTEAFCIPEQDNITIIRVPKFSIPIFRVIFEQTLFYFYEKKSDYLFTPSLSLPFFFSGKKILTIHDIIPFFKIKKYNWIKQKIITLTTILSIKKADLVVTVSENSKQDLIKHLNIDKSKIRIIYNFICDNEDIINITETIPDSINIPQIKSLSLKEPFFLTVSTLQPAKNIAGLINAFNLFLKDKPDYYLYIVGDKGWGYAPLFNLVKELHLESRIFFLGYLDDNTLSILYSTCIGVVYVSFYEGFGIPPLEGFYHNKACVASDVSSIPEVVGKAGILVNPYDINSIDSGLKSFLLEKNNLIKYIPKQLEKFNPKLQIKSFINLFTI